MARPRTSSLTADKLRELARTGAEVALKRLRAEMIAIERTFPELALPGRRRALRKSVRDVNHSDAPDFGGRAEGRVGADEEILGRTQKGTSQGQVTAMPGDPVGAPRAPV